MTAPKMSVQTPNAASQHEDWPFFFLHPASDLCIGLYVPLVEVNMVVLPTVVYCRQAIAK